MPRSKRSKIVALTKTKKKLPEAKTSLVKQIQESVNKYERVLIFEHVNMKTEPFRQIQQQIKPHSKFFLGKNKVMKIALGKDEETSFRPNLYLLTKYLKGETGLLFTNKSVQTILEFLNGVSVQEYAHGGQLATDTVLLQRNTPVLHELGHSIEPYLRELGLNTSLINQKIELNENYLAAEKGKPLSVEQSKILKLLKIPMGEFRINVVCIWERKTGSFKKV